MYLYTGSGQATVDKISLAMGSSTLDLHDNAREVQNAPRLTGLPDEVLLEIALSLDAVDRNHGLQQLALTCRRLSNIAREALGFKFTIKPYKLRENIAFLSRNPKYLSKIRRLELYAVSERGFGTPITRDDSKVRFVKSHEICVGIITSTSGLGDQQVSVQQEWISCLSRDHDLWYLAHVAVLLVLLSKAATLSFTDDFLSSSGLEQGLVSTSFRSHPSRNGQFE